MPGWLVAKVPELARDLGALASVVFEYAADAPTFTERREHQTQLIRISALARDLYDRWVSADPFMRELRTFAGTTPVRLATWTRVMHGLARMVLEPQFAITPPGLGVLELCAGLVAEWQRIAWGAVEHRAQLGDAALVFLLTSPMGAMRALVSAGVATASPESVDAVLAIAGEAGDELKKAAAPFAFPAALAIGAVVLLALASR